MCEQWVQAQSCCAQVLLLRVRAQHSMLSKSSGRPGLRGLGVIPPFLLPWLLSHHVHRTPPPLRLPQAMCLMFKKPRRKVVGMLRQQPDLVFMTPRILHNKFKVGAGPSPAPV